MYFLSAAARLRSPVTGDYTLDFTRLRRGSMLAAAGTSLGDAALDHDLSKAIDTRDDKKILAAAERILDRDIAHVRAHVVSDNVLRKTGHPKEADFHHIMARGLLQSIFNSGDGQTPERAFRVFHVREEYDLARLIDLEVVGQSVKQEEGRTLDVLRVKKGKEVVDIYFDITELFALTLATRDTHANVQ